MKNLLLCVILLSFAMMSCSGGKAVRFDKNSSCRTVIEGSFQDDYLWKGKVAAIVTENFNGTTTKYGKIVEVNDDGIVFDEEKQNYLSNPDPKKYSFKDLVCVIDENRNVIHGTVPGRYKITWTLDMELANKADSTQKKVKIKLVQGEKFAYCIAPGTYYVSKIVFKNNRDFVDVSTDIPNMRFEVAPNCINYVGDIHLDNLPERSPNTCAVSYKIVSRPSDAMVGFAFGLVGALLQEAARSMNTEENIHTITVDAPEGIETSTGSQLPFVVSPLTFKSNNDTQTGPEFETIKVPQTTK